MGKENPSELYIGDRISFAGDSTGVDVDPWPNGPSKASRSSDTNHDVVLPPHVAAIDAQLARRVPNERWSAKPKE